MRESKMRRIVISWISTILLVIAGYQLEQASSGSTAAKLWAITGLSLLVICICAWSLVGITVERIRTAANTDGLFVLESLGERGDSRRSNVDRDTRRLIRVIAMHLKSGEAISDDIRSEAIRLAELALSCEAAATYDSVHEAAGLPRRRQ